MPRRYRLALRRQAWLGRLARTRRRSCRCHVALRCLVRLRWPVRLCHQAWLRFQVWERIGLCRYRVGVRCPVWLHRLA